MFLLNSSINYVQLVYNVCVWCEKVTSNNFFLYNLCSTNLFWCKSFL